MATKLVWQVGFFVLLAIFIFDIDDVLFEERDKSLEKPPIKSNDLSGMKFTPQPEFIINTTKISLGDKVNLVANITKDALCYFEVRIKSNNITHKENISSIQKTWSKDYNFSEEGNFILDVHCNGHYAYPSQKLKVINGG